MALRRLVGPAVAALVVSLYLPAHAMGSMENQVFGLINGERSTALLEHSGLLAVARAHSAEMAASGGINHDNADWRISNAPADPPQPGGGPDAGFAQAAWCENVASSSGFPEAEVGRRLYEQWHNSTPHQACMTNEGKNVAAVGIYYDGSTWWATFIAEVDHTPPGGAAQQAAPQHAAAAPAATSRPSGRTPAATAQPAVAPRNVAPAVGSSAPVANTSPDTNSAVSSAQTIAPIANRAPIPDSAIRPHEVAVNPVSKPGTLLLARRGEQPVTEPAEIAGLLGIALIAFRRIEKRPRSGRRRASGPATRRARPDAASFPVRGSYVAPRPVRELVSV